MCVAASYDLTSKLMGSGLALELAGSGPGLEL